MERTLKFDEQKALLGEELSLRLPPPNLIAVGQSMNYEQVVAESEVAFSNAVNLLKRHQSPQAAILQMRAQEPHNFVSNFLHFIGEALAEFFFDRGITSSSDLQTVTGFAKWAYIGRIHRPVYAQNYPFSCLLYDPKEPTRKFAYASCSIWFKEIPMEIRGEYVPPFPEEEGWELTSQTLYMNDWVYVIRIPVNGDPPEVPNGWELLLDTSGVWRISRWKSLADEWDLVIW